MSRLIPHPLLSAALVLMWLLLNSFSLGHLILGTAISLVAGWAMGALEPTRLRVRKPHMIVKLFFVVGIDIIRSNIAVAWLILSGGRRGKRLSQFVRVKLNQTNPVAKAMIALILTATPGSSWMEYDIESDVLLIHVFDYLEAEDWQELIEHRYGHLLREIFV